MEDEMKLERSASPYSHFSLQADEATDSANKSVVVTYIRFITAKGDVATRYLCTKELPATTSGDIYDAVCDILKANDLSQIDMVGLATDGASVMMGVHKGVATR